MLTPGIEADILQRPDISESGQLLPRSNVNLNIDCDRLASRETVFFFITVSWIGILTWWVLKNCHFFKTQTTVLQKLLLIIPVLKLIDTLAYYLFLKQCPWLTEENEFASKYLIMTLVTVSSIYHSIIIGIFMMISSGWTLLHNQMSRDYATRVTVTMGVTYLWYSAYFVSLPNSPFRVFMEAFMAFIYSYICYFWLKFTYRSLWIMDRFCSFMRVNRVQNLLVATQLKHRMMRRYMIISMVFFAHMVVFQGLIPLVLEYYPTNLYFTTSLDMVQQIIDVIVYFWLLYNFRSRDWPLYFMIASFELGNLNQFVAGIAKNADYSEAWIPYDLMNASFRSWRSEYEEMILNSESGDSESGLANLNVLLINPSFEEEYNKKGYEKMQKDSSVFEHLVMGTKIK